MRVVILVAMMLFAVTLYGEEQSRAATTFYVTDDLSIPMRSGPTQAYRIIGWPKAGTALVLLAESDDGKWAQVRLPSGKEGWVNRRYVTAEPAARSQLKRWQEKAEQLRQQVEQLRQEKAVLRDRLEKAVKQYAAYQSEVERLKSALETAEQKVARLSDVQYNDLFLKGAAVALASILLGVLLGRRRRRSGWA